LRRTGSEFTTNIRTINNCEDAFGHMIVQMDGELCTCGNYGCVESYSSITRIKNKFVSEAKKGKNTNLTKSVDDIEYIDVCNLAENNDDLAKGIIIDAATYFGTGLANYIKLLNPQIIILSGPLIKHSTLFYETSKKVALKKCRSVNTENIEFCRGGYFENKSIALGAAYLVLDEITKDNKRR
jgi:predicted NBD/HSP70 family sugar kinase